MKLFNLQGQMVRQIFSKEPALFFQDVFDMRQLPKGLYVLKAENSLESISQKVVR